MGMTFFDTYFCPQRIDHLSQRIAIKGPVKLSQEKRSVRIIAILALGKVSPHESASRLAHIYNSPLASLCFASFARTYADFSRLHVYILHTKRAQLAGSQS